jgi:hypothetical protein
VLNWHNFKATVFRSYLLNIQMMMLVTWTAILHATGLGVQDYDLSAFVKIWGTVCDVCKRFACLSELNEVWMHRVPGHLQPSHNTCNVHPQADDRSEMDCLRTSI